MLTFPSNVRLYLATGHTDLRRSFNGLSALVEGSFGLEARSGDLFIFLNRRCTQVRILFWARDGDCIVNPLQTTCALPHAFRCSEVRGQARTTTARGPSPESRVPSPESRIPNPES